MPHLVRALALALLISCSLLSSGCATAGQAVFGDPPAAFGGTRLWAAGISKSTDQLLHQGAPPSPLLLLALWDLPLSLAFDLALLPVTVPLELSHEDKTDLLDLDRLAGR